MAIRQRQAAMLDRSVDFPSSSSSLDLFGLVLLSPSAIIVWSIVSLSSLSALDHKCFHEAHSVQRMYLTYEMLTYAYLNMLTYLEYMFLVAPTYCALVAVELVTEHRAVYPDFVLCCLCVCITFCLCFCVLCSVCWVLMFVYKIFLAGVC